MAGQLRGNGLRGRSNLKLWAAAWASVRSSESCACQVLLDEAASKCCREALIYFNLDHVQVCSQTFGEACLKINLPLPPLNNHLLLTGLILIITPSTPGDFSIPNLSSSSTDA